MVDISLGISIGLGLAGIAVTWLVSRWYYKKGSKQMSREIREGFSSLESLHLAQYRLVDSTNPNRKGKLVKSEDGKWGVQWTRSINESVPISENVVAKLTKSVNLSETIDVSDSVDAKVKRANE